MGRTLPWKTAAKNTSTTSTSSAKTASRPNSPPPGSSSSPRLTAREASPKPNHAGHRSDQDQGREQVRPPSTPRQPQPQPVPERLMIPGLRHDDKWRMVEDEFVAVAHKFTAHLHAAEYQRLRERARQHNSDAIRSISRPASGPVTDGVKRRQAALSLKQSQSRGIKRALTRAPDADEADADELPWAGTNLQELMNSPRKKPVPLTRLVSSVSGTRAAALHRQDSTSTRHSSLQNNCRTADRHGARTQHVGSPLTERTASVRAQHQSDGEDDVLDRPSASRRLAQHISSASRPATVEPCSRSTAPVHMAPSSRKSVSMPITSNAEDDSDSSMETFFDRRMRERRAERKLPQRRQSQPPEVTNNENQPRPRSERSQVTSALSIPSI